MRHLLSPLSLSFGLLLLLLSTLTGCQKDEPLPPPNILWIVSEDNSPFLGAYGDEFATTPHLDAFATEGVLFEHAFASAPVCAPARNTLITGVYPPSMGTQHMRSQYALPEGVRFFSSYLREAGYYTSNNVKKDYNVAVDQSEEAWDESSGEATYRNRQPGQPFFAIFNYTVSHESSIHKSTPTSELRHDPKQVPIPPYHPRTEAMEHDWAQYYDKIEDMDNQVGDLLAQLEADSLADSTIVFYYSDHGGILGRSKRFLFESGMRVPLIVRVPEMYRHLFDLPPGSKSERIVSFIDFAPTLLSLAGVEIPDYMQGHAFMGEAAVKPQPYAFGFRGRMDEVYDMGRTARDERFRYVRNFMPHRIYGQYLSYLWRAPSMQSWDSAFQAGGLNETQSAFFQPKPAEELYDVQADPHNIENLADDPAHAEDLERMRKATFAWMADIRDAGLMPEGEMISRAGDSSSYAYVHSEAYPFDRILETADLATRRDPTQLQALLERKDDPDAVVRYWVATGLVILAENNVKVGAALVRLSEDASPNVAIAAAEGLLKLGAADMGLPVLERHLDHPEEKVRTHALNVIRVSGEAAAPLMPKVRAMVEAAEDGNRDYDVRAARVLLERMEGKKGSS